MMTIKLARHFTKRSLLFTLLTLILPTTGFSQVLDNPVQPVLQDVQRTTDRVRNQVQQRVQDNVQQRLPETLQNLHQGVVTVANDTMNRLPVLGANNQELFTEVTLDDGTRVLEREWLVVASAEAEQVLQKLGSELLAKQELGAVGMTVLRFKVPAEFNDEELLRRELPDAEAASLARHYVYDTQGSAATADTEQAAQQRWCETPVTIGMIDTAVDTAHPAFASHTIVQKDFLANGIAQPTAHGTAVAGLLVGSHEDYMSLVPQAKLYSAAIFHRHNALQQGAALLPLLEALNWLAEQQVRVINMSLTGPGNPLLEQAVKRLSEQNILLVAAAGNDGPAAPASYPAAYDEVIAVTAVDGHGAIYRWANQGEFVEFAARGVQVKTARRDGQVGYETGTSMAAPAVSAAAACIWHENKLQNVAEVRQALQQRVIDLGTKGRDSVFGFGLLTAE
ncbi:Subtilase family protein [Pseudidiomarina maritima]|uniref:Subtilase family protein n=1 Tax=Pseudidiomarina maritima TaxID=519453 RepID=A0A1I6HAJ7_9GAMM|nr:S8 family serine peptidase [Pseudidiomarina maritima]SFR51390.1 Subtilase family protein [Pseudidiomarina maritima]